MSLSFGNQTVNTTSAPQTVTLTNTGDEPVTNANDFYFDCYASLDGFNGVTDCPASLPSGDSCQIQVTFAPNLSQVGLQSVPLAVWWCIYEQTSCTVAVTGTGVLPSSAGGTQSVALSATTLNFGTEAVGTAGGAQTVYLTNTGSLPLTFLTPTVTLTSSQGKAADFQVGGYAYGVGAITNPQAFNYFSVILTPSAAATETATLTIPIAGSSTVFTVSLVGQGVANTQTLEFQPGNWIFPDQPVGTTSAVETFYIFNAGNTPFVVDRALASGDFSVTGGNCPGSTLPPATAPGYVINTYCYVYVVFAPSQTGPRSGTLTVIDAASATPQTIPLSGNGITAAGVFTVTPTQLDFGTLVKGTSSAVQYVTLTNSGDISINFTAASTTGDYAITYNNCGTPYTIGPGASNCQIGATFTPTVTASPDNGTLVLTTSAGSQTITLTGGGEAGTLASGLSPTSINFGQAQVNQTTPYVPVYVRNSGTETFTFSTAATVTGNFSLSDQTCATAGSGTLAPGQDCYIYLYFTPAATGTLTGTLTVKSNAGTLTAGLTGMGVSVSTTPTYFSPPAVSFDQQAVNSISAPITVSFSYGGTSPTFALTGASITAGSANFQLASGANALNTCSASQGSTTSCQVNVVYSPSAASYETGTLTVASSVGSFPVTLSGYAPPASDTGYLSPSALSFPSQVVNTTSTNQQTIYLYNTGAASFTVGTLGGTDFGSTSEFGIYGGAGGGWDSCSGQTLAPVDSTTASGGSCYVYVQFAPSAVGTRTGTLSVPVTYSDGTTGSFTAGLTGIGVAQYNEAVLSPTLATFPDAAVGTFIPGNAQTFYLTNSGNLPFTVGNLTSTNVIIGLTASGDFTDLGGYGYDGCSLATVNAGSNCFIEVYFLPRNAGTRTGSIVFPVTYANSSTPVMFTATLTGNGIAANPAIAISPAGIQFDTVTVSAGVSSNYQPITVTNTGNVPVTFTNATLTTGFSMAYDYCTGPAINPGASCQYYVYFNPTTTGTFSGSLSITDNAPGSPQKVALSGTSLAATSELQFSQTTVSFGNQLLNAASSSVTVNLINRGTDAVTISTIALAGTDPGDFSETDSCAGSNLAANSICTITLTFTPLATGSRTATLTETDTGSGGPRSISLSGSGINASTAITFYPAALTFSSTEPVGEGSPQQFFSVTNIGVNPVTISAVSSTNATAFPIAQNGCTGNTLATGQSCLIVVLFTPASAASLSGYIDVTDNASGSPQKLPVSGTGIAELTSAVTLTATPTSAAYGSLFTLVATVKDQNSNPLTNGRVTFYDGTTALATVQVVSTTSGGGVIGTATLKTILVPLGSNSITAKYAGGDATSTSAPALVTVTGTYPSTTTFASSGSAGDYTFTGTVSGAGPLTPTGSVTFTDGTTDLVPGTAAINPTTLAQTFAAAPTITGLNPPVVVAMADLNGDGIPDLVTGTQTNGLLVQLGNGDGTFQAPTSITAGGVSGQSGFGVLAGTTIVFGDFNGDGKVDIAFVECANASSTCAVGVLLGNGDGTFQKERYYDQSYLIGGIAVGDFNGDGILDIAVANYGNGTVDLILGNGDGTFQEPLSTSMPAASSIAAADLIGNGKLDLVVTNWAYGTVSVLLGNGNGTFQAAQSYSTPASGYPNNATLASLRSNGKLDIVIQDYYYGVSVLLGNGNGTFLPASAVYSPISPSALQSIAVADVNGDGKPDLVVTDNGRVVVSVLAGNGDGTFQAPNSYPTGATPVGVAIADLNHDGRPDIAVADLSGPSVTILLNQVTQTATLSNAVVPGTGTHAVSGAYSGDTNFAASTSNTLQLAASLVTPTMQLAGLPSTTVAWGQALSVSVTLTGPLSFVPDPTGTVSYTIDGGTAQTATLASGAVTIPISQLSVGAHSIAVSYGGDKYYTTLAAQTLPVTVIKANQTITFNTLPNVTYGVAPITLSATSTSGLVVSFTVTSGPASLGSTNNILTITGAGTVVVTANQAGNADYNAANAVPESFTVGQVPLTVTVNSATKIYGAALPTFSGTITGLVNGDTLTATYSSTGTASSPVGSYPITVVLSGSALANYSPTVTPGTLTITKAVLTVTANNASRVYGAANPAFTDTITGFVNGDTQTVVSGAASLTTTATLSSTVGTYPITAAQGTLSASNYTFNFVNGTLTINQATPAITWSTPAPIIYGTALSGTQLDASSTVAGTFAYTPASGTVLTAGSHTLSVTLTPTDATDYTTATKTVSLTVNQATPAITWATPAAITYGTALSATQLDATSAVAGTFVYSPASGTVLTAGAQTLSVTLTPTDTTDYTTATATVTLTVNKAMPAITWATPAAITYGTALSATQLDATSAVAGTFVYSPASGTVLSAGAQTLSVTLTPTDTTDYTTATATVTLTITKAVLTVTANNASRVYGAANPTFTDTVTGFVNGDTQSVVSGAASLTTTATLSSTVGAYPITAAQGTLSASNYTFNFVNGTLTVNQATPAITWATPAAIAYGTALSATQLDASSTVAGTFVYSPASGTVLTVGAQTLSVTLTPTDKTDYTTATATVTLTITKAVLTVTANNASRVYGVANPAFTDTIAGFVNGDTQTVVSGAASLTTTATLSSTVGTYPITAAQGTLSASNYTFNMVSGTLTINQATPAITWPAPAPIIYGTALSGTQLDASSTVAGTFVYTPASGTVLAIGTHTLSVTLTPTDTTDYTTSTATVQLTVNPPVALTTPTPGTVLAGSSVTFTWTSGTGVTDYQLWLGTTGVGSHNLYESGATKATTVTVSGLPTYGVTVYARLWWEISGVWQSGDYTYTEAGTPVLPVLTTPAPGSVLSGSSVAFTWTAGGGPASYQLWLGTTGVGSQNLYNSGATTATTETVSGLPANGAPVYARLWWEISGAWQSADYIYFEAGTPVPPGLITPVPGRILSGSTVTFAWTPSAGVTDYQLWLGSTGVGSQNLYDSGATKATTVTVSGLATNGVTMYARLWWEVSGVWTSADYIYTEAGTPVLPVLTTPAPGTVLSGSSVAFTWTAGAGPAAYQLYLGTTGVGSHNLYESGSTKATTVTVNNVPTYGLTVYARLWWEIDAAWKSADYTYTEAGAPVSPVLTTPAPGSVLPGSSVAFTWTAGGGPSAYQLYLGTTGVGSHNLYESGATAATTVTVSTLPTAGVTVYARLWWLIGATWSSADYTYTESGTPVLPALTTPTPGSVLSGSSVAFTWTAGAGPAAYQLYVGTTGVGSHNLYESGATTATTVTVSDLPTTGVPVYVRLWWEIDAVWQSADYTYTAQ
jgi:hypothetical protein